MKHKIKEALLEKEQMGQLKPVVLTISEQNHQICKSTQYMLFQAPNQHQKLQMPIDLLGSLSEQEMKNVDVSTQQTCVQETKN